MKPFVFPSRADLVLASKSEEEHLLNQYQNDEYPLSNMDDRPSTSAGSDGKIGAVLETRDTRGSASLIGQREDAPVERYRTYKRRWFGLAQLILLNVVISWDVSNAPIGSWDIILPGQLLTFGSTNSG
jgi:hypothetical protein